MSSISVGHYGLHKTDTDVFYLHQGRYGAHNFIGLGVASPFEVVFAKGKKMCPHLIAPAPPNPDRLHWDFFCRLLDDPLVNYFLPVPKNRADLVPYLDNVDVTDLVNLSRLSSPLTPIVLPFNRLTKKALVEELSVTNLSPLVLYGLQTSDHDDMMEIATEARMSPRTLMFVGDPTMVVRAPVLRIKTSIEECHPHRMISLPLETLGAICLKRYARGEQLNGPFVRRSEE